MFGFTLAAFVLGFSIHMKTYHCWKPTHLYASDHTLLLLVYFQLVDLGLIKIFIIKSWVVLPNGVC